MAFNRFTVFWTISFDLARSVESVSGPFYLIPVIVSPHRGRMPLFWHPLEIKTAASLPSGRGAYPSAKVRGVAHPGPLFRFILDKQGIARYFHPFFV